MQAQVEAFLCSIMCWGVPHELHMPLSRAPLTSGVTWLQGEGAVMQGDVAWCEYKESWLRGSATFYLPSTIGAMPRSTANAAGWMPPECSVPASHFRTAYCPRRITSCYTRWWLTNMTKAYRLHLGKALILEDCLPSPTALSLLSFYWLISLLCASFRISFSAYLSSVFLSSHFFRNGKMMGFASACRPVGEMHIYCGTSVAERFFQKLSLQSVRPNT